MKYLLALIFIQLTSCASYQTKDTSDIHQKNTKNIPFVFAPLYYKFTTEAEKRHVKLDSFRVNNLRVSFADFTHDGKDLQSSKGEFIIGLCTPFDVNSDGTYSFKLEVDKAFWERSDVWHQESLFFHELGHCVLKQDHRKNSIMYELIISGMDLRLHEKEYLDELFFHVGG